MNKEELVKHILETVEDFILTTEFTDEDKYHLEISFKDVKKIDRHNPLRVNQYIQRGSNDNDTNI